MLIVVSLLFVSAFPLVQTKLVDFFQIQKCSNPPPIKSHSGMLESMWASPNLRISLVFSFSPFSSLSLEGFLLLQIGVRRGDTADW